MSRFAGGAIVSSYDTRTGNLAGLIAGLAVGVMLAVVLVIGGVGLTDGGDEGFAYAPLFVIAYAPAGDSRDVGDRAGLSQFRVPDPLR